MCAPMCDILREVFGDDEAQLTTQSKTERSEPAAKDYKNNKRKAAKDFKVKGQNITSYTKVFQKFLESEREALRKARTLGQVKGGCPRLAKMFEKPEKVIT